MVNSASEELSVEDICATMECDLLDSLQQSLSDPLTP